MVQNLNNNLITAPELADLRKRLRNLETKVNPSGHCMDWSKLPDGRDELVLISLQDGQTFFVALFRSWCHNAVATFSLCLLAQAYEQAYHLLQILCVARPQTTSTSEWEADALSAELEMTVNMLIQIDKLVQLLESPVFTCKYINFSVSTSHLQVPDLRLQLLEPEKYPHLYKCLYGVLMLLPQSSAFAALKNRLNSVSAIGYLHIAPRAYVSSNLTPSLSHFRQKGAEAQVGSAPPTPTAAFDRPNRLKAREEGTIRWGELLEKFKSVQEKAKRLHRTQNQEDSAPAPNATIDGNKDKALPDLAKQNLRPSSAGSTTQRAPPPSGPLHKPKSSLGNFGRLTGGVGRQKAKK